MQWLRWRLGTFRAAKGTIKHVRSTKLFPQSLVDAGARNSEFMRYLAVYWPWAEVHSFEIDEKRRPIGARHLLKLGSEPGHRLSEFHFRPPALLKVDCDEDQINVLNGADLTAFEWAVVEVSEDGNGAQDNNRSQIDEIMRAGEFDRSKAVDAVVCIRSHRIAQTDVLYWRSPNDKVSDGANLK